MLNASKKIRHCSFVFVGASSFRNNGTTFLAFGGLTCIQYFRAPQVKNGNRSGPVGSMIDCWWRNKSQTNARFTWFCMVLPQFIVILNIHPMQRTYSRSLLGSDNPFHTAHPTTPLPLESLQQPAGWKPQIARALLCVRKPKFIREYESTGAGVGSSMDDVCLN